MSNLSLIRHIETLARDAWPAEEAAGLHGWIIRFNQGVTRRANSVWPNELSQTGNVPDMLDQVERFYRAYDQPPRYQICPAAQPVELDALLSRRGYAAVAPTHVQIAELATLLARTRAVAGAPSARVTVHSALDDRWFATYQQAEEFDDHAAAMRRAILQRIAPATGYALLVRNHTPVALGLGVAEDGMLGIFSMATVPAYRRQGAATAVLHALGEWAAGQGATRAYLQVMHANRPAQALYARAGFETLYDYHYRELADGS